MNDQIFDRQYQAGRHELNAGIDRLVRRSADAIGKTFEAIHKVQFDAPWTNGRAANR